MKEKKLTFLQAVSLAVGTMIGASIFSIFGVGVKIAGTDLPFAFILSGIYALMVGYSYAKLGTKIVSNAGPIAFIEKAIGGGAITGSLSILMWISYVISIALFAISFAGYLLPFINIHNPSIQTFIIVFIISLFGALNFFGGSEAVGKLEFWIVLIKILILLLFIVAGFTVFNPEFLHFDFSPQGIKGILNASVIFFLSYMGFGLITNASENIESPEKTVPKAIFISIIVVLFIYVSVSLSALGAIPVDKLVKYQENALAVAAEPALGKLGFFLLSIGALISISSALNATLYSGANAAYALMKKGYIPFPRKQLKREWMSEHFGLYLTCSIALLFALFFNITSVASMISLITTVIYIFVIYSHLKLTENGKVDGNKGLIFFNLIVITFVAVEILKYQYISNKKTFLVSISLFLICFILETFYYSKHRKITISRPFKLPFNIP
ncbi:APC family permease [Desulfurobacterium atlanticum]|uniref:Amino acid:proton symporter, ABT family n=1 Tax=Desulfurobacterium atlanticum TaxID=240169 RepID=A0A238Z3L9_9BACT|nr:APC family permease [Desulfurobacterium atlanticum]SNR77822.1 amino acid:proton symporter, ABT family [Desulfurobacterium atlanticum]